MIVFRVRCIDKSDYATFNVTQYWAIFRQLSNIFTAILARLYTHYFTDSNTYYTWFFMFYSRKSNSLISFYGRSYGAYNCIQVECFQHCRGRHIRRTWSSSGISALKNYLFIYLFLDSRFNAQRNIKISTYIIKLRSLSLTMWIEIQNYSTNSHIFRNSHGGENTSELFHFTVKKVKANERTHKQNANTDHRFYISK